VKCQRITIHLIEREIDSNENNRHARGLLLSKCNQIIQCIFFVVILSALAAVVPLVAAVDDTVFEVDGCEVVFVVTGAFSLAAVVAFTARDAIVVAAEGLDTVAVASVAVANIVAVVPFDAATEVAAVFVVFSAMSFFSPQQSSLEDVGPRTSLIHVTNLFNLKSCNFVHFLSTK